MRLTNLALVLSAVCLPAAVIAPQIPTTNLSYAAFQPYQNGKIVYKIWAQIYIETQQPPNDPDPSPDPNPNPSPDPNPNPDPGNPPQKPLIQYMTSEQQTAGIGQVLHPTAVDPYDPPGGGDPWGPGPGEPPSPPSLPQYQTKELLMETYYYCSPMGLFSPRVITAQYALAKGVTQAQIDSVMSTPGMTSVVFKESSISIDGVRNNYIPYPYSSSYANSHPAKGVVALSVAIPQSGQWVIKVTDTLANEKAYALALSQGPQKIIVSDIEAGNTLVALYEMQPNGQSTTYFQEAYALVRKNETAVVGMVFGESDSASRYRIGHLGVGQNSQSVREVVPLQGGRDAMVRIMVYDSYGQGKDASQTFPVQVSWSLPGGQTQTTEFLSHISGHHAASGRLNGRTDPYTLGPTIPAAYIQPGLQISAKLLEPGTGEVLHQVDPIQVDVVPVRTINISGYQVKPPTGSGAPIARDTGGWNREIMPYTRSAFPYSNISYTYRGSITMWPFHHVMVMSLMNAKTSGHSTDHWNNNYPLNVGIMNWRYASGTTGMCWYGYPGISLAAEHGLSYERVGYALAHEMGHAFGLEHAPSKDANGYVLGFHVNRVDNNYPYGGGGMAGGWGYADIIPSNNPSKRVKHFLSEDAHILDNAYQAHWDLMAYLWDKTLSYKTTRLSDYNQRKMFNALKLNLPSPTSYSQEPDDPFADLPVIPGTNVKVFGPEQAHAVEDAWYSEYGVRSVHAVNPAQMDSTPLDFDISAITVTDDGHVVMPYFSAASAAIPAEFAHLAGDRPEGDGVDMIQMQGIGDGHIGIGAVGVDVDDDDDDDDPPYMIVTRLPRLLGLNVEE